MSNDIIKQLDDMRLAMIETANENDALKKQLEEIQKQNIILKNENAHLRTRIANHWGE